MSLIKGWKVFYCCLDVVKLLVTPGLLITCFKRYFAVTRLLEKGSLAENTSLGVLMVGFFHLIAHFYPGQSERLTWTFLKQIPGSSVCYTQWYR